MRTLKDQVLERVGRWLDTAAPELLADDAPHESEASLEIVLRHARYGGDLEANITVRGSVLVGGDVESAPDPDPGPQAPGRDFNLARSLGSV